MGRKRGRGREGREGPTSKEGEWECMEG